MAAAPEAHAWEFKARFRSRAFGWKSQPAVTRVKQAVTEIRGVAKKDPLTAGEGAVLFLERVTPAIEGVDSSSGSMGTAVNNAVAALAPIIASAPADAKTRDEWLDRLFQALQAQGPPYIESLGAHWGDLCASREMAAKWAAHLLSATRLALSREKGVFHHFPGTSACLSAHLRAEQFDDLIDLLRAERFWPYAQWAARAMAAQGRVDEAIAFAESRRREAMDPSGIDVVCEQILIEAGRIEEAWKRYAAGATPYGTYVAMFRSVAAKYPGKSASEVLALLVAGTPGEEGKWFAAAKTVGLFDDAIALANHSPCDPRTLARALRDYAVKKPAFALGAGLAALRWLAHGYGYETSKLDVLYAYSKTIGVAGSLGVVADVKARIAEFVSAGNAADSFAGRILVEELRR